MAEHNDADTRFDRLLALTEDAFAARHYPAAYYTLVAAMCEAEAARDIPRLVLAQTIAEEYVAQGEHSVASLPPLTSRTLLTILAKRIYNKIVLIQQWRMRHDRPPDC